MNNYNLSIGIQTLEKRNKTKNPTDYSTNSYNLWVYGGGGTNM